MINEKVGRSNFYLKKNIKEKVAKKKFGCSSNVYFLPNLQGAKKMRHVNMVLVMGSEKRLP